jgi:hypothetical protein
VHKVILFSIFDKEGLIGNIEEKKEPKGYWEIVNVTNRYLGKKVVNKDLESLDRARTWEMINKVEGEKKVSSK